MIRSDRGFYWALGILGGGYLLLIVAMIAADLFYTTPGHLIESLLTPEIRFAIYLTLGSTVASAVLSTFVAIPLGYLLSRVSFPGKRAVDALLDVPIVLPPIVVGLSLLILLRTAPGQWFQQHVIDIEFRWPSVILAQTAVAAAFAVRAMKITFDQLSPRSEQVAMTLGCSRGQAFLRIVLPEARQGIVAAFAIAWARSLGEFGPVLIISGATPNRTEVLSTAVWLELNIGRLESAVAVSLFLVVIAFAVLIVIRLAGPTEGVGRSVRP
jgi:molybdate transport system permease protein